MGLDLNQRRLSQRIYSPSPLTTRAPIRTREIYACLSLKRAAKAATRKRGYGVRPLESQWETGPSVKRQIAKAAGP